MIILSYDRVKDFYGFKTVKTTFIQQILRFHIVHHNLGIILTLWKSKNFFGNYFQETEVGFRLLMWIP